MIFREPVSERAKEGTRGGDHSMDNPQTKKKKKKKKLKNKQTLPKSVGTVRALAHPRHHEQN
jgi:hypothetical protein